MNRIDIAIQKPIVLFVKGEQYFEGTGADGTELMTEGTMTISDEAIQLSYQETELTGMAGVTTIFRVEPTKVILTRTGRLRSEMVFEKDVCHDSLYTMELGTLLMTVCAQSIFFDITPEGGMVDLVYTIDIEHTQAGVVDYHLDIRAK